MTVYSDKKSLALHLLEYVRKVPFDAPGCAKYFYTKKLDERTYRFNDKNLNKIMDEISGMDAGDEFFFSQEEIISMLNDYIEDVR